MVTVFLRKYATLTVAGTTAIQIPMTKRAVIDFAVGADWTPVAGDVKVSIDGGAAANVTNLPTAIAMGNTAYWQFVLTAAELTCKQLVVTIADAAAKVVEDNAFVVETFGHASAMLVTDLSADGAAIKVKTDFLPSATAGAAGGVFIAGANAATTYATLTVTGATVHTGNVSMAAGLNITQSTADTSALVITGTGTGDGIRVTGGATGSGLKVNGGATSGDAVVFLAGALGHGFKLTGIGSGKHGLLAQGGTNGSGASLVGAGTNHGLLLTKGTTGDGLRVDTVNVTSTLTVTGAASFGSTLAVTGTTTLAALTTTGAVTFNSFTPNFAADVITASALASSAVTEIQTGMATAAAIAALNNISTAQVRTEAAAAIATDVVADSVPADGSRGSLAQYIYMVAQFLFESAVSGTSVVVKKPDGSAMPFTLTINSATVPTSITRAT